MGASKKFGLSGASNWEVVAPFELVLPLQQNVIVAWFKRAYNLSIWAPKVQNRPNFFGAPIYFKLKHQKIFVGVEQKRSQFEQLVE